jgi:hypothetical protein
LILSCHLLCTTYYIVGHLTSTTPALKRGWPPGLLAEVLYLTGLEVRIINEL